MAHKVTKLILPVAGLGKRLRPLTNRLPKALVRLNGRPLLGHMLKEAEESGITEAIIIASPQHKKAFASFISKNSKKYPGLKKIHLRVQRKPLGDGHAILQAIHLVRGEPVAVRFSDDVVLARKPVLRSLVELYEEYKAPVLLLERVPWGRVSKYGIVSLLKEGVRKDGFGTLHHVEHLVEKPAREAAPSNLAIVGGYVITPRMLRDLERGFKKLGSRENDALRLIAGFQAEAKAGRPVHGFEFKGMRLDCGTLEGFYEAQKILSQRQRKGD